MLAAIATGWSRRGYGSIWQGRWIFWEVAVMRWPVPSTMTGTTMSHDPSSRRPQHPTPPKNRAGATRVHSGGTWLMGLGCLACSRRTRTGSSVCVMVRPGRSTPDLACGERSGSKEMGPSRVVVGGGVSPRVKDGPRLGLERSGRRIGICRRRSAAAAALATHTGGGRRRGRSSIFRVQPWQESPFSNSLRHRELRFQ